MITLYNFEEGIDAEEVVELLLSEGVTEEQFEILSYVGESEYWLNMYIRWGEEEGYTLAEEWVSKNLIDLGSDTWKAKLLVFIYVTFLNWVDKNTVVN